VWAVLPELVVIVTKLSARFPCCSAYPRRCRFLFRTLFMLETFSQALSVGLPFLWSPTGLPGLFRSRFPPSFLPHMNTAHRCRHSFPPVQTVYLCQHLVHMVSLRFVIPRVGGFLSFIVVTFSLRLGSNRASRKFARGPHLPQPSLHLGDWHPLWMR